MMEAKKKGAAEKAVVVACAAIVAALAVTVAMLVFRPWVQPAEPEVKAHDYDFSDIGNSLAEPPLVTRTSYEYDASGNCVRETTILDGSGKCYRSTEREYDGSGGLAKETELYGLAGGPYSEKHVVTFEGGLPVARDDYGPNLEGELVSRHYTYEYDGDPEGGSYTVRAVPDDKKGTWDVEHYSGGRLVKKEYSYYDGGGALVTRTQFECSYDLGGNMVSKRYADGDGFGGAEERCEYGPDGRLSRRVFVPGPGLGDPYVSAEYSYDEAGRLSCEDRYTSGARPDGYTTYRYDDAGRLVERGDNCEV